MLRRVDRILLRVPQLDGAVRYYRDVLGLPLARKSGNVASFHLAATHETELVLHTDPDLPAEATYFLVDDVRELYRRRNELKLKFTGPPQPVSRGFRATVKDPFDNVLLLLDRTAEQRSSSGTGAADVIENAKPPGSLFAGVESRIPVKRDALIKAYESI